MRKLKVFTHSVLLMCTFTSFAYPQSSFPLELFRVQKEDCQEGTCPYTINNLLSSYDLFLQLLDDIETDEIENKCNEEELDRINHFLALLARMGLLPGDDEDELERDIEELLSDDEEDEDESFSFGRNDGYLFAPANGHYELLLCKSRVSKVWKKTKKKTSRFCKKHKKGLIIGSAVVLGGVGVILAVASCATAGAVTALGAAGAAAASGSSSSDSSHAESKKSETKQELPDVSSILKYVPTHITDATEAPMMKGVIDDHISSFKELLGEDRLVQEAISSKGWDELSFGEKAREIGANISHQAFEEISDLVKIVPQLCEEVEEIGAKFLPESLTPPNNEDVGNPRENYENIGTIGHQVIDKVFSTAQSELFTAEAQANDLMNNFAFGMIPLPGSFNKIFSNAAQFKEAGKVIDRAGFTKAGRGLMKHGNREGSVFPKPSGNPTEMNRRGQMILEEILNDPHNKVYQLKDGSLKIYSSKGRGAFFKKDGSFRGFIEQKYE